MSQLRHAFFFGTADSAFLVIRVADGQPVDATDNPLQPGQTFK
jgi:hypothetical protein